MSEGVGARRTTTGKEALTLDEIDAVLEGCDRLEQKALLALAVSLGARRGDVVGVERERIEWVDREGRKAGRVEFWEEKKDRWWEAWLLPRFASPVRMQVEATSGSRWLFPSSQSVTGHISSRTAWNWFHEALSEAGLKPRPFHALRASCIKMCQALGWSVEETMEQVGATWETIQTHYTTPSDAEMEDAVFGEEERVNDE